MPKRKRGVVDNGPTTAINKLDSEFPPVLKRRCLGAPDVTVIVGDTSFRHHSFILCYASEYFDTMLSSGMIESEHKIIEFPDKEPDDWKVFYPFLEPRSLSTANTVRVTKDNAKAVLPFFHEFDMADLLKESDEKLWSSLLLFKHGYYPSEHRTLAERRTTLMEIMDWTSVSDRYGLQKTRAAMMKELMRALNEYPELIHKELLLVMVPFWSKACDIDLWVAVKSKLPSDVTGSNNDDDLKSNPLFLDLLVQSFQVAALAKNQRRTPSRDFASAGEDSAFDLDDLHPPDGLLDVRRRYRPAGLRDVRHRINAAREEFDDLRRHHGLAYRRLLRRRQAAAARLAVARDERVGDRVFDLEQVEEQVFGLPDRPEPEAPDANQLPPV
eukprot:CAMPEP_0119008368 /NCGR_PEP_ID=MMETSP1176-20130426/3645_1 /TAXON_ID=265551 /ORGANISM="Synedropsis recta cf, Strain CCMP1620" /LENGTH=383 /DNA_ID=CAMNT_0006960683 /DNA_START=94 /DNA_END=1245 /DNA_ORIENTATION=-